MPFIDHSHSTPNATTCLGSRKVSGKISALPRRANSNDEACDSGKGPEHRRDRALRIYSRCYVLICELKGDDFIPISEPSLLGLAHIHVCPKLRAKGYPKGLTIYYAVSRSPVSLRIYCRKRNSSSSALTVLRLDF